MGLTYSLQSRLPGPKVAARAQGVAPKQPRKRQQRRLLKLRGTGSYGVLCTEEPWGPSSSEPPLLSLSFRRLLASLQAGGVLIK